MAVPAHAFLRAARATPAAGVGIAAVAAHFVAANAVGSWPLVVATGAQQNVSPCFAPVAATRARVVRHPTGWMGIAPRTRQAAHAALQVARLARFRCVTT